MGRRRDARGAAVLAVPKLPLELDAPRLLRLRGHSHRRAILGFEELWKGLLWLLSSFIGAATKKVWCLFVLQHNMRMAISSTGHISKGLQPKLGVRGAPNQPCDAWSHYEVTQQRPDQTRGVVTDDSQQLSPFGFMRCRAWSTPLMVGLPGSLPLPIPPSSLTLPLCISMSALVPPLLCREPPRTVRNSCRMQGERAAVSTAAQPGRRRLHSHTGTQAIRGWLARVHDATLHGVKEARAYAKETRCAIIGAHCQTLKQLL